MYLPFVQRIHNSASHAPTKVSPAQILFGNALDLDRNLFPSAREYSVSYANLSLSQYADALMTAQDTIVKVAQENQRAKDNQHFEKHKEKYMKHKKFADHQEKINRTAENTTASTSPVTIYEVDSYVLVAYPMTGFLQQARAPHKFMPVWKGPYKVVSRTGASYTLLDLVTMKEEDGIHVRRLKQFFYDEKTDPRQVANQATNSWDVERILSHTGKMYDKNRLYTAQKMTFTVKWVGFEEPTVEPFSNRQLFKTAPMHEYLRANKLKTLIPAAYK